MTTTRAIGNWPLDEPFPRILRDRDLMRVLGISPTPYCRKKKRGEFKFLELRPQPPGHTAYSGHLVERWLNGDLDESRYFQRARRRA